MDVSVSALAPLGSWSGTSARDSACSLLDAGLPERPVLDPPALSESDSREARWIGRVREGDEEATVALVERLYPTIVKCVRCHRPRRTSEEDLVQVVFSKIFHKLEQFSGRVPLEHWVSRIAVNTCIKQLKHESIRPELRWADLSLEQERLIEQLATSDEDLPGQGRQAARELVEKLLHRLKPADRLVITLLHLEERSVQEVSELTGWSASRVKVTAFRARHKMHKLWKTMDWRQRAEDQWMQSA
jgi:RNA polymerase sigma factor (sigma-70 family)